MWPKNDSSRPYIIFTGLPVCSASRQAWTCIERSSRPPNAPPTPASEIRTLSGGRSRLAATWSWSTCSHWVETNRSTPPSSAGIARPDSGPEERLVLHADLVLAGDDDLGRRVRVAVLDVHVPQQVAARVQRLGVEGQLGVGDRLEHLVVDLDLGGRVAGGLRVVGGDDRDRLALVADLVPGQHRLVGDLEPVDLAAGHVLVREHGVHAADRERRRDVQLADARPRVRAAQGRAPQHPVGPQVGRVGEVALHLGDAVGAADALADAAADGGLDASYRHLLEPAARGARCRARSRPRRR